MLALAKLRTLCKQWKWDVMQLINTAIARAKNPFQMAESMKYAVISGRKSFLSGRIVPNIQGSPSTTKKGLI